MIRSSSSTNTPLLPDKLTFKGAAGKSSRHPVSPSGLAAKLINDARKIQPELPGKSIDFCRKSLFARTIDQLNKYSTTRHQLPLSLDRLLYPTNPDQWNWATWKANKATRERVEFIFRSLKKELPWDERVQDFLSDYLTNQWPRDPLCTGTVTAIIRDRDPLQYICNMFKVQCIHVAHFIKAAIKASLLDAQFINRLYDEYVPGTRTDCRATSTSPDYQDPSLDKLVRPADELAKGLLSLAEQADGKQPLCEFISVLNQEHSCGVNILMPTNPDNNPTSVDDPAWLTWELAVYKINGHSVSVRNSNLLGRIYNRLLRDEKDPVSLYCAFKCDEGILGLDLDLGAGQLHSKNSLCNALENCEGRVQPITKLITGLIRFGCLTKECTEEVLQMGISNLKNVP